MVKINRGWYIAIKRPGMSDRDIRPGIHPLDKKSMQKWCDEYNQSETRNSDGRQAVVVAY